MHWSLHNIRNLEITIYKKNQLFALVECEELNMIRRLHIIIDIICVDEMHQENSEDDFECESEDAYRDDTTDLFEEFPDV